jgi:Ca2+/H+ antiporter
MHTGSRGLRRLRATVQPYSSIYQPPAAVWGQAGSGRQAGRHPATDLAGGKTVGVLRRMRRAGAVLLGLTGVFLWRGVHGRYPRCGEMLRLDTPNLCALTQPNFTRWCAQTGQDTEDWEENPNVFFKTQTGDCVQLELLELSGAWRLTDPGKEGTVPGYKGKRCVACAPFTDEADCNAVCVNHDSHELNVLSFMWNVFVAVYACYALALCCEDYFVASLEVLIERAGVPSDVAGATFMAAGSSSPELFVAAVTIFLPKPEDRCEEHGSACIHKDPGLGMGTVVGSCMFNTMCIIGGSALVAGSVVQLDWRIVLRDAISYAASVLVLMLFLFDEVCEVGSDSCIVKHDGAGEELPAQEWAHMTGWGTIELGEACAMVLLYVLYVLLCWHFRRCKAWRCCSTTTADRQQQQQRPWAEFSPRLTSSGMVGPPGPRTPPRAAAGGALGLSRRVKGGGAAGVDSGGGETEGGAGAHAGGGGGLEGLMADFDDMLLLAPEPAPALPPPAPAPAPTPVSAPAAAPAAAAPGDVAGDGGGVGAISATTVMVGRASVADVLAELDDLAAEPPPPPPGELSCHLRP